VPFLSTCVKQTKLIIFKFLERIQKEELTVIYYTVSE
jgi:hypothetical protein